jgi:signal transduction histidine kinase
MELPANIDVVSKWKKASRVLGYLVILIGLLVILGWILHSEILVRVFHEWPDMRLITAICIVIVGLNIVTYDFQDAGPKYGKLASTFSRFAIYFVCVVSLLEVIACLFNLHFKISEFLGVAGESEFRQSDQRMTFIAALCLFLLGSSLIMLRMRLKYIYTQLVTLVAICLSLMGIFDYLFWSNDVHDLFGFERTGLHTSISFLFCSASLLLLKPQDGWLAVISSDTLGGSLVRKLLPGLIVMLLLLIELRYVAQKFGYIDTNSGVALSAIIGIVLICYSVLKAAKDLAREDIRRRQAEQNTQQLNRKLEARTNQLENANNELQQMIYIASHDLQEPLKTISNYSGLIYKKCKDSQDKYTAIYFEFLNGATKRMRKLIHDIFSYGNACRIKEFIDYDCNEMLREALLKLESAIAESSATFEVSPLPVIYCHKDIAQLFEHLISNAIKYRKKNVPPVIVIDCKSKEDKWLFSIADNGIGIPRQYFGKIFKLFQKLHAKHEYEGSGIGLAICRKIVECHNGEIWVESTEGNGSTFYFTISKTLKDDQ